MTAVSNTSSRGVADTVTNALATPEKEQPYAALGLTAGEYASIREILGRRPTSGELAMYSVMWSEHCSYKSSKPYLRQFGQKVSEKMKKNLMVGMGPRTVWQPVPLGRADWLFLAGTVAVVLLVTAVVASLGLSLGPGTLF